MAKSKRRIDNRGPMQKVVDAARIAEEQSQLDIITPEQRAKGTYCGDKRITNRGGTPIMRWIAAGKISETQGLAISLCMKLWAITGLEQRTTASYGERIGGGGGSDSRSELEIDARDDLHRIKDYIPDKYWEVFENVCRFDEPAGVAGSRLGYGSRSAEHRAHTTVCFVADIIADREWLRIGRGIVAS